MVKRNIAIVTSVIIVVLVVIAIAITTNYKKEYIIEEINNTSVVEQNTGLYKDKLPSNCMLVLNDDYCICKEQTDDEVGSGQYPDSKEKVLLYEISTGQYKEIIKYPKNYNSLGFVMENDNVFWIEHHIRREDVISGSWKIKQYNIPTSKTTTIDEGGFEDFQKYAYNDINFSDATMLFPVNIDVSDGMLVYNKLFEKNNILNMQIILYDILSKEKQVVAQSDDYVNNYLFDVSISDNYVVYNSYYDVNDDKNFRPTTYKYCDLYLYNIKTKKHKKITEKEFFIDIDSNNGKIVAARIPVTDKGLDEFACMQIVLLDLNDNKWNVVLHNESPIYSDKDYLMIGNPQIKGNFIIWQDNTVAEHRDAYNYKDNSFLKIAKMNENTDISIIGATESKFVCLEIKEDGSNDMYMIEIE